MAEINENFSIEQFLQSSADKSLLRFLTAGSVDDGKSTLIGRLLYDSKSIFEDHLLSIKKGSKDNNPDLALLTDGLRAEREQGITIDVAYRYFSTPKRTFILADTPGHEQYTRNMATGASSADLVIILIDARNGILPQTKRHSFIASLLGISHFLIAVNKMDAMDFSQDVFENIKKEYLEFSERLKISSMKFIPVSALLGDNIVGKSKNMPWYQGETVLNHLEEVYIYENHNPVDFRFPVQIVSRPNMNFRGFAGQVASGSVKKGESILVLPSGKSSTIKSITTFDGELDEAHTNDSVTLSLNDEIDISRGDMIVRPNNLPHSTSDFEATLVWLDEEPLDIDLQYVIKQTSRYSKARFKDIRYKIDVNTLSRLEDTKISLNDISRVSIKTTVPLFIDTYRKNKATGCFILVHPITNKTVAAGMIIERIPYEKTANENREKAIEQSLQARNIFKHERLVKKIDREERLEQKACTLWMTGLSGSGKSTIATLVEKQLFDQGKHALLLDGDNIRAHLNSDLGFSEDDRKENIRRVAEVAKLLNDMGIIVISAFISPFAADRAMAREIIGEESFREVFINTPLEECEHRDPKGLYKKARGGEIDNFTGISSPYEAPSDPDLECTTTEHEPKKAASLIISKLFS